MSSAQCEGFAGVKLDAQADFPVDSEREGYSKIVICDDALHYLSEKSRGLVDPLVDFSASCAICR